MFWTAEKAPKNLWGFWQLEGLNKFYSICLFWKNTTIIIVYGLKNSLWSQNWTCVWSKCFEFTRLDWDCLFWKLKKALSDFLYGVLPSSGCEKLINQSHSHCTPNLIDASQYSCEAQKKMLSPWWSFLLLYSCIRNQSDDSVTRLNEKEKPMKVLKLYEPISFNPESTCYRL